MFSKFTLTRKERLSQRMQFDLVFKRGMRFSYKGQVMAFVQNRVGINRVGFIVPKSKVRLSSTRNRIKRLLREAFRLNKNRLKGASDIIVIVNKPLDTFLEAQEIVTVFFDRLNRQSSQNETNPH